MPDYKGRKNLLSLAFIYLHGLLSSSKSKKGLFLKDELSSFGNFYTPDFYPQQKEFEQMTINYLLDKIDVWVDWDDAPVVLIGSSFGGLMATRFIQTTKKEGKIVGLILLAPALNYYKILKDYREKNILDEWKKKGYLFVDHPAWQTKTKWSWKFVEDLKQNHHPMNEPITIPTLLLHGTNDDIISVNNSQQFVARQSEQGVHWDVYYLPGGNHQLSNVLREVKEEIIQFIKKI
ncbi:MAG: YqiA/YcfP family alpha/beta fold hydrolase [Candidatus Hodarchaeales archaeon]